MSRVGSQIATDHAGWAYPVMGANGFIEVPALSLWRVDIWRTIDSPTDRSTETASGRITDSMRVADVLDGDPHTEEVFLEHGFTDIRNPVMRRTISRDHRGRRIDRR